MTQGNVTSEPYFSQNLDPVETLTFAAAHTDRVKEYASEAGRDPSSLRGLVARKP